VFGVLFYSYTYQWFTLGRVGTRRWRVLANGLVFGLLAVVLMIARIQLTGDVYIDARAVPVALISLLEGWPAGLLAALPPAAYRVWLGGPGAPAGVLGVVGAALIAAGVRHWARRHGDVTHRHAFLVAALVFLWTFGTFVLVGPYARELFGRVWLPILVAHVVGVGFTARLLRDVQAQARQGAERERFRAILDEASDAIRILDADTFKIIDVNRRECELSGYRRHELIGRDSRTLWPEDAAQRAELQAGADEARARGVSRAFGVPYRTRNGAIVSVDTTRRLVEHEGRRYEIVMFHEAADREAAEAARREAAELRAVTLLAGAAAHEINNPLAVVVGALGLLERKLAAASEDSMLLTQAMAGASRIRDIVARMTRITRVESTAEIGHLPPILDIKKSSEELL
jgi:PAS domain S-box-containing protein